VTKYSLQITYTTIISFKRKLEMYVHVVKYLIFYITWTKHM